MPRTFGQILDGFAALKPEDFDYMRTDSDLGSPGPLVHTLERMRGHYESELVESVRRRPTPLAVWMVNRVLNATRAPEQRQIYLDLLRIVAEHPTASDKAQEEARRFIEHQTHAA